jgi:hypothetical protein
MKGRFNIFGFLAAAICLLAACNKDGNGCFEQQGNWAEERRTLDPFSQIITYGVFDIVLVQDTMEYAIVACGENHLQHIQTEVGNGSLNLYDNVSCKWSRKYQRTRIEVHLKNLTFLKVHESSNIRTEDTLRLEHIWIYARSDFSEIDLALDASSVKFEGSKKTVGKYYLKGHAGFLEAVTYVGTILDAGNLQVDSAHVFNHSMGDVVVDVTKKLEATLTGAGNIVLERRPGQTLIHRQDVSCTLHPTGNGAQKLFAYIL